jgi:hypothetical protein
MERIMSLFRREPAEIRRLRYQPTLLEECFAILREPTQLGLVLGALVGAIAMALLRAGNRYAARKPKPADGLVLPTTDPAVQAAAAKMVKHVNM